MPTLTWIGKEKVVNHHQEVPYRVLEHKYGFRADNEADRTPTDSGNKIIHGDNLEALKSLLPQYEGRIKCIYIDPPYNTGNEKWVYNDNVNDPKIKKWLGEVVGKQGEDLSRHDKWLCMMYPRLKLLQKLLAEDGAIFISIDDNEQAHLKLLCDEIFGANNFIGQFSWVRKKKGSFLSKTIRKMLEYVLCYQKTDTDKLFFGEQAYSDKWQPIVKRTNGEKILSIPEGVVETSLPTGTYHAGFRGNKGTGIDFLNPFEVKDGFVVSKLTVKGRFVWIQEFLDKEIANGSRISLSSRYGFNVLRYNQDEKIKTPSTLINETNGVGTNEDASADLQLIFNSSVNEIFQYSKPESLISYLSNMVCYNSKTAIILDSFAGSGTTAHAVLKLNEKDGGNRKFILVEMEDYAESITAERVRRVMKGYGEGAAAVAGTGGAFDYYELGEPMFDKEKNLNENIGEEKIREYIYYTETKRHLERERTESAKYLLDTSNDTGYYFYYEQDCLTTLGVDTLHIVTEPAEQYVIHADVCTLSEEDMAAKNIVFKKIPRDIKRF